MTLIRILIVAATVLAGAGSTAGAEAQSADTWDRDLAAGRRHWAFQKPVAPDVPAVRDAAWPRGAVDRFLIAAMEQAGVKPVADAGPEALIRRLAFDLTGLPPTPDEVREFAADPSPEAVERLVDRLLASPRFGERWARHWLDVARYADSSGKETNVPYPHAWRYRDWVIAAFNADMPYDRFLKEQLAGDLLKHSGPADQAEKIVATGFLALGPKSLNERDRRQFQMDVVDEQIDALSQSMLGLTLACARCHDHKFDPVTQRDYYALAGIFLSSETLYGTGRVLQNAHASTLVELPPEAGLPVAVAPLPPAELARLRQQVEELTAAAGALAQDAMAARREGDMKPDAAAVVRSRMARDRLAAAQADLDQFRDDGSVRTLAMGVLDRPQPADSRLLERGEVDQPGAAVPRGLVEVLCGPDEPRKISEGSGRLDLAFWIASRDHPLTARVMANRVWLKLMGEGLVTTPDNFGIMGMEPSHPDLLDHLAVAFMEDGWSVKRLIRRIVLSRGYQLAAVHDAANFAVDPDNRLRWRMDQRRLDAEVIRDAMLAVAGRLDLEPTPGSPVSRMREDRRGLIQMLGQIRSQPEDCRSIYLPIVRDQVPEPLGVFDFPDASLVSGQREESNVPSQALFMLNNAEVVSLAKSFADRVAGLPGNTPDRLAVAFEMALGRRPTPAERSALDDFWADFSRRHARRVAAAAKGGDADADSLALAAYCQALFATAEFRHLH
jgi:cytochrome c553